MPAVPNEPSEFVQRIPIPPDVEEVEVKRRVSVPGKPVQWVTVKEWRQRRGVPKPKQVVSDTVPPPIKLKTGVVKPNPRPVKKPKPVKVAKPKRVFNQQPVGARQHGAAPRCSFCGGGMASEIGTIHTRCQEAKDRIAGRK